MFSLGSCYFVVCWVLLLSLDECFLVVIELLVFVGWLFGFITCSVILFGCCALLFVFVVCFVLVGFGFCWDCLVLVDLCWWFVDVVFLF